MIPDNVQILFADLQPTLVAGSQTISPEALTRSAVALARNARLMGIPITFSLVPENGEQGSSIPELCDFMTGDNAFWRRSASAFLDPATVDAMAGHGRKTLILSGYAAEVVVFHSALAAIEAGYTVYLPVDAIGARSARTEAAVFRQIEGAGGVTTCVSSLLSTLAPDFSKEPGQHVLETLKTMRPAD